MSSRDHLFPPQIPPNLHRKPLQKPTSLYHRKNNTYKRRSKHPNERNHDPPREEAAGEDVVGEEHRHGNLSSEKSAEFQMMILFDGRDEMTYEEIHDQRQAHG